MYDIVRIYIYNYIYTHGNRYTICSGGTGDAWPLVSSSAASKALSASLSASFFRSMLRRAVTKQP